jgi:transcription factor SFP1
MGMSLGRSFEERPKLEAQFFRNFSCCGLDLQDLHGLLEHFEECHVAFEGGDDQTEVGMEGINDGASEGTISGPPSPRLAQGGVNRNVFELKKSALGAFDSPGPTAAELHPDGGM